MLLTLLMLLVLQGCGVGGGDGSGNTVPVVVTMTMPGPTVALAPQGLFQRLWARLDQLVTPKAWAGPVPPDVGGSPSFIQSVTLTVTANGETLASTTVNVTAGETVMGALDISAGSNRVLTAKVFDGANGTGRCRFPAK